jgi:hypothetical protein
VRDDLAQYCQNFAEVVFHGATKGKTWMCPAKMIQIILMVIAAIVAVVSAVLLPYTPVAEFMSAIWASGMHAWTSAVGEVVI